MRSRRNIITGLDVGTTKISAIVGEVTDNGLDIISVGSVPSAGLRKGVVVDIESTVESIKKAVKSAEERAGVRIRFVYVGIAGGHIKGFEGYGAAGIKGKEVRPQDVERVIDSASAIYVPLDREVLQVIPAEFILDGQGGIKDPVGMSGLRLEVKAHIVTGAVSSVRNLLKCCETVGLDVIDIVLEPIASAEAVLARDEKDSGIALVDIGGGTTDIAVYKDGSLRHTAVLALGGNHLTNDIAIGMRIPVNEAERIKKKYGCAIIGLIDEKEEMDVIGADRQMRKIPRKYITEIIEPRCEELIELIRLEIENASSDGPALSGIVLTGGASLLEGFDRMAETALGLPVRVGAPEGRTCRSPHMRNIVCNPMNSTGIGIILFGLENETGNFFHGDLFDGVFGRMRGWINNLFGNDEQEFSGKRIAARQRV